ncbi:MAG: c-type cytochrome biogenesis protein CcmI [Pseudomonadota bacterium]
MTTFWIFAAGLMLLAIGFIVLPLLRGKEYAMLSADELNLSVFKQQIEELENDLNSGILDQTQYDAARKDLEKELLEDVNGDKVQPAATATRSGKWIMSVAMVIPLMSIGMYQALGEPEIIPRLAAAPDAGNAAQNNGAPHTGQPSMEDLPPMEELVKKLAAKMEQQPDNLDGWLMLGRSYMTLKQPQKAIGAYEKAMQLNSDNSTLLLAYAEAIAQTQGKNFTGKPAELIEKAHKLAPQDTNSLWMMGIVSYQREQFQDALDYWEKLESILTPQSKDIASVQSAISDVRAKLGVEAKLPSIVSSDPVEDQAAPADTKSSTIEVILKLSPELKDSVKPDDLVFIYAKAVAGPPMPLAAVRKKVKDLPLNIILDDNMAMMPQMKLSLFSEVVVGARISKSGSPSAQPGDLEGEIKPVTPGQPGPILVTIDSVHK